MPVFSVKAMRANDSSPVKVEFHLGGTFRGYTPDRKDQNLIVETQQSGSYQWFAKRGGRKIQTGSSRGGQILIVVD